MDATDFKAWMARLNLTYRAAADQLGLSERSVYNYADKLPIPVSIELACEALEVRHNRSQPTPGTISIHGIPVRLFRTGGDWNVSIDHGKQVFGHFEVASMALQKAEDEIDKNRIKPHRI